MLAKKGACVAPAGLPHFAGSESMSPGGSLSPWGRRRPPLSPMGDRWKLDAVGLVVVGEPQQPNRIVGHIGFEEEHKGSTDVHPTYAMEWRT